jgi:thiol-disulfide isomerase/thioredoxin
MRPDRQQFGGAALLVSAALSLACATPSLQGRWDAVVVVNDVEIPFRFDIVESASGISGAFFNGDERIESTSGRFDDRTLTLSYDHYATRLEATLVDGRLEGRYERGRGAPYLFRAARASASTAAPTEVPSIAGLWHIPIKSSKGESAWRFIVHQTGPEISAAILRVDGDTGALTGRYQDGKFVVSHFSGQRPALMEVTLEPDGTLAILQNRRTRMTAVREQQATARLVPAPTDPSRHSLPKNPAEHFSFSFADADGRVVSSSDERFRNKVVVVSITGTWCPNCHDEAPFLTELYQTYRGLGLEIVALSFEEEAQLQNPARLRAYAARYGIDYPMLLAGIPDQLAERVPQIENLNSFPTTIFLDRNGLVRNVHAGFPSKASGRFYTDTIDSIRGLVERLLTEEGHAMSSSRRP